MLSVILRRSTCAANKVLHWAAPPQRLALSGASDGRCAFWTSTSRLPSLQREDVRRSELSHVARTHSVVAPCVSQSRHFHSSAVCHKKREQPEAPPRELDLLRYDMKELRNSPRPALYLGFAGLIPFVCPSLIMALSETFYPELAFAQLAYAASIVSFLGGARWGFALPDSSPARPDWINLSNSVVPPLLAALTMGMSHSLVPATTMVIMALGISLHYDLALLPTYPSWFKALRSILTLVAFFSLLATLLMNGLYPEKKLFQD